MARASSVVMVILSLGFPSASIGTLPGTKWCGNGNEAEDKDDLGFFSGVDTCCRDHDTCKLFIRVGETKFNMTNTGTLTWNDCNCDRAFLKCLKTEGGPLAFALGVTFFDIIDNECLHLDHPEKCVLIWGFKLFCKRDTRQPKKWQLYDKMSYIFGGE